MITATCIHHWLVESPNGQFSLAKCKKCGKYDAMSNSMKEGGWTQTGPNQRAYIEANIERESFLRERMKEDQEKAKKEQARQEIIKEALKTESRKRTPIIYTSHVKTQVLLDLIKGKTVTEASRINKVPTSTIHGWKDTYSSYPKVKVSGDTEIFKKIIIKKSEAESNLSSIARDYDIPRRTLRGWIKKQVV